jgi:hypothetical protein
MEFANVFPITPHCIHHIHKKTQLNKRISKCRNIELIKLILVRHILVSTKRSVVAKRKTWRCSFVLHVNCSFLFLKICVLVYRIFKVLWETCERKRWHVESENKLYRVLKDFRDFYSFLGL